MNGVEMEKEKIMQIVFKAVDEINMQLSEDQKIKKDSETVLFGKGGILDSLGLVNFISMVEQKINTELGVCITLADDRAISQKNSPFKSLGALVDYICSLIK